METKYEPIVNYKRVYVSKDGSLHHDRTSAIRHDAAIFANTRKVKSNSLFLPNDETYMRVFNVICQEDWDYLFYTEWEQNIFGDKYTGPCWYGSIKHSGGDFPDEYEIIKIDSSYIKRYEDFINELKDLTLS